MRLNKLGVVSSYNMVRKLSNNLSHNFDEVSNCGNSNQNNVWKAYHTIFWWEITWTRMYHRGICGWTGRLAHGMHAAFNTPHSQINDFIFIIKYMHHYYIYIYIMYRPRVFTLGTHMHVWIVMTLLLLQRL